MRWDPTKPHNYGDDLENWGVEPDVWVRNSPMDQLQHSDKELKAAIAEVQKMRQAPPTKITSSPTPKQQ
jgi:C-terminal processing protease CtpA/Prc